MDLLNEFYEMYDPACKNCPCCQGHFHACKGAICKELGQCYCKTVKDTEGEGTKAKENQ